MYNDNFQYDFVNYEESNQKKTKKNSKLKFIILIIVTIVAIILSIVFIKMASTDNYYIILDNSGVIEYSDGTYSYAKNDDYLKSNFRVFSQKEYVGNYYITRVDTSNDVLFTKIIIMSLINHLLLYLITLNILNLLMKNLIRMILKFFTMLVARITLQNFLIY